MQMEKNVKKEKHTSENQQTGKLICESEFVCVHV